MIRLALLLMLSLSACSPRGEIVRLADLPPDRAALRPESAAIETIFVATSRKDVDGSYGFGRSDVTTFLRFDVAVPQDRDVGEVEWPRNARFADPRTDFLTYADRTFAEASEFREELSAAMERRKQDEVIVYVHGYNNTYAEGLYRVAQMHHDLKVPGVAVHYAWPSRGSALGYVYDRDSALFARDGLEQLLVEVARSGARRIVIVGHSMGGALVMETLRTISLRGEGTVLDRLGGVILISPDLDVDVFRSQARSMGGLPQPFVIFGSRDDSVLGLSSRISGDPERLGNLTDLSRIAELEVTYLDTAAFREGAGHMNLASSPALIQLLSGVQGLDAAFRAEARARVGLLPGVVLTLRSATQIILAPVEGIAKGR